jgi:pimeloyl-ACP methyl ester carboxylesterase
MLLAVPLAAAEPPLATTTWVPTEDGAWVSLHHHPGRGAPVVLVHGISSNHRFFDLSDGQGLADWLVEHGRDVWMLDLRGHGDAERAPDGKRQRGGWTVDDYGRYDVHAAIERVCNVTGARQVDYLGHSMGGMVGAIYLGVHGDERVHSATFMGSPGAFDPEQHLYGLARAGFALGGAITSGSPTPVFAEAAADLGRATPGRLQERLYNRENMDRATIRTMLREVVSPLYRREMRQFGRMMADRRFESWDRSTDWLAALAPVTAPLLVIAGAGDEVAAPEGVQAFHGATSGPGKLMIAGELAGMEHDYGHLDLGLGARAAEEIYPEVLGWMRDGP